MTPKGIKLHKGEGSLALSFPDGNHYTLSGEYLRVHSPSAEVKGHGPGQEVLQWGKKDVKVTRIERAGNYAVQLSFDDGHDTGIYSWSYLHELCVNREEYWQRYLDRLHQEGKSRDPEVQVVRLM